MKLQAGDAETLQTSASLNKSPSNNTACAPFSFADPTEARFATSEPGGKLPAAVKLGGLCNSRRSGGGSDGPAKASRFAASFRQPQTRVWRSHSQPAIVGSPIPGDQLKHLQLLPRTGLFGALRCLGGLRVGSQFGLRVGGVWNAGGFERRHLERLYNFLRENLPDLPVLLETGAGDSTITMLFLRPARLISIAPDAQLFERIRRFCQEAGFPILCSKRILMDLSGYCHALWRITAHPIPFWILH